jgi:hypothetical protein
MKGRATPRFVPPLSPITTLPVSTVVSNVEAEDDVAPGDPDARRAPVQTDDA